MSSSAGTQSRSRTANTLKLEWHHFHLEWNSRENDAAEAEI